MQINTTGWKEFRFGDLVSSIKKATAHTKEDVDELPSFSDEGIPYVSRTELNNSVDMIVRDDDFDGIEDGNAIVIGDTTSTITYQPKRFVTGDHIVVIRADWLNLYTGLFIVNLLRQERYRYSYGRAYKKDLIADTILKLPATKDCEPDWQYMEEFMGGLHSQPLTTSSQSSPMSLETNNWKEYRLGALFDIRKGKRLTSEDQTNGDTLYIGAIDSNNGVANYIGQAPIHKGNTISLSYNGSVGEAFYQPDPYWATDDVNALYFRKENHYHFNMYLGLFICAVLRQEKYRFSYGRKWTLENMRSAVIKLPSAKDGTPDWAWMEKYIKSLPMAEHLPDNSFENKAINVYEYEVAEGKSLKVAEDTIEYQ